MFMIFHAQIIIIHSEVHKSLLFRNEEKLVALLVYFTFIRVATSGFGIIPFSLILLFVSRNEEKLVAIKVYSSFGRVATSGFRIIPKPLVVEAGCAQMKSDSGITPYSPQHCNTV